MTRLFDSFVPILVTKSGQNWSSHVGDISHRSVDSKKVLFKNSKRQILQSNFVFKSSRLGSKNLQF